MTMTERWKPEKGEQYWIVAFNEVAQSEWQADNADFSRWRMGNCFKTKEEAVAALKKITALLLSLHDNDSISMKVFEELDAFKKEICKPNLPKLTTEVFDRPDCPEWAKYAAVNADGRVAIFSDDPSRGDNSWRVIYHSASVNADILDGIMFDSSDWQNSLIERPVKKPKLTAEVFDRYDCPEWAKYAAVDYSGVAFFYENKPIFTGTCYQSIIGATKIIDSSIKWDITNSQNSLIERPAVLPDWVEIGGYVYDARNGYGKIVSGSVKSCYIEFDGGAGDFVPEAFAELKQAQLRPYNADELENLVGKVIKTTEQTALVSGFIRQSSRIVCGLSNNYLSGESLLVLGVTIAGKPCGVLEHLEDGEWVE